MLKVVMSSSDDDSPRWSSPDPAHSRVLSSTIVEHWRREAFCDVVLIAAGRRIPAHRVVLASFSDYFSAMFSNNLREAYQSEIEIHEIDSGVLYALVKYIYTGELLLEEDQIEDILAAACLLQLSPVVEQCSTFLMKQLHPTNCLGIRQFAVDRGCNNLYQVAYNYVKENFRDVVDSQEFLLLPEEELCRLLESEDLNITQEEELFSGVMNWVGHDEPSRKQHIPRLLALIKLPLMTPQFLADHVECHPLLRDSRECQQLVLEALKYHLLPERQCSMQSKRTKPRKSTVGVLLAVGGIHENNKGSTAIERYDYRTDTWTKVHQLNSRRLQFGVAVVGERLYIVGGRDGLKTLDSVEYWDMQGKEWCSIASMSNHRHGLGVAVLEGPIYAVGGHDGWSYLGTVERWDPQSRQWSYVAPMHCARSTVSVAVLGRKLYAVGGRDGGSCLRTVECFDPHTNKWTALSPMSKRRGSVAAAACNGFLYAVGGHDAPAIHTNHASSHNRFSCVERYDPKIDQWTFVTPLPSPRESIGIGVLGDKLFIAGGFNGAEYLDEVQCYDPQTQEWTKMSSLLSGRVKPCLAQVSVRDSPIAKSASMMSLSASFESRKFSSASLTDSKYFP